jgi:hypothetical protein
MKRMAAILLILVALVGGAVPGVAHAQSDVEIALLRVGLWPEFDQPELLVIYWGELTASTSLPATLTLRLPENVEPFVVAAQPSADAAVDEVSYDSTVEDGWRLITFQTNGPRFQFEYYVPLNQEGSQRTPAFTWPGDYAVESLAIELQQPPHASDLRTIPELPASEVREEDNLTYHGGTFGPLQAGEPFTLQISYSRDEDTLTFDLLNALQSSDTSTTSGGTSSTFPTQAGGSGGTDVLLLVVVAVVFFLLGAATMRIAINIQAINRQRRH